MTMTMTAVDQQEPSVPPTTKVYCTVLRTYRRGGDGMPEADIHVGVGSATRTVTVFPSSLDPVPNVPPAQPYEGGRHPDPTPETTYSHQPDLWRDAWAEHLEDVERVLESPAPAPRA